MAGEVEATMPERDNLNEQVMGWIPSLIGQLPDRYREAIELYEVNGLTQQEIADRLGISLSGAKSRVQRGREKLKAILNECCSFEQDRHGNIVDYQQNNTGNCCDPSHDGCT